MHHINYDHLPRPNYSNASLQKQQKEQQAEKEPVCVNMKESQMSTLTAADLLFLNAHEVLEKKNMPTHPDAALNDSWQSFALMRYQLLQSDDYYANPTETRDTVKTANKACRMSLCVKCIHESSMCRVCDVCWCVSFIDERSSSPDRAMTYINQSGVTS